MRGDTQHSSLAYTQFHGCLIQEEDRGNRKSPRLCCRWQADHSFQLFKESSCEHINVQVTDYSSA